jgi:hypothetical protein
MSHSRKKTLAFVAPLTAAALMATAGVASADTVYNATTNTPLANGAAINGTNVGNSLLQASNVTVTCQTSTASGTLGTNGTPPGTAVGGSITSLGFSGTGTGSRCTTNSTAAPTATATTSISASTPATVAALAGSPGSFNVTSPVTAQIRLFNSSGTVVATCNYSTSSVAGSVPAGSNQVTFSQALSPVAGNPFLCPNATSTYKSTIALTSGGDPIRIANP